MSRPAVYSDARLDADLPSEAASSPRATVAAVSYLNAAPLLHGLEGVSQDVAVTTAPPASLLAMLLREEADVALAPVVDALSSPEPVGMLPVGGIACQRRASTVVLCSQQPLERLDEVYVDAESHTSVALVRIVRLTRCNRDVRTIPFDARSVSDWEAIPAALLIGDKVRTLAPSLSAHPHRLDMGAAWRELTGLPFVFACWMCLADRAHSEAVAVAALTLDRQRRRNALRLDAVACAEGPGHGWPVDEARSYLTQSLHYDMGQRERQAVETFWSMAVETGVARAPAQRPVWLRLDEMRVSPCLR